MACALLIACACATEPLAPGEDHALEIATVVRRIDEARAQRGMSPSQPLHRLAPDMRRLAAAYEHGQDPDRAIQDLLRKAVESLGGGVAYAWIGYAQDLAALPIPDMLLGANTLRVAVGIARCKPPGADRQGYCALVAAVQQMGSIMGAADGVTPGLG
jgi:hypothetical protein